MRRSAWMRVASAVFAVTLLSTSGSILAGCAQESKTITSSQGWSYQQLTGEDAAELIAGGSCTIVDVRGEVDYDLGHIPGAIVIPLDDIADDSSQPVEQLPDKNAAIIVYCDYGGLSKTAAERLAAKGYTQVMNFDGLKVWNGELETGLQ